MSLTRHRCIVLANALLVASSLCGVSGVASAQVWKAHGVPLFVSASNASGHQGFVRVINRSDEAGEVRIDAIDDTGASFGPVSLAIGAGHTVHFTSGDLERGNTAKGLSGGVGPGRGSWRLRLRSPLDLEVLAYNRTRDGLLTTMHDLVPRTVVRRPGAEHEELGHRVAIFNPASSLGQVSRLRIINRGDESATVTIEGVDDEGASPGTAVELSVPAGASRMVTSRELESGQGEGLSGMLGDGQGRWRLVVTADSPVEVMNLLTSPTGHLANLSTEPKVGEEGVHEVALFAAAANPSASRGFARIINRSGESGEVSIEAFDDAGAAYGPVTLGIGARESVHLTSGDLELGNAAKGLSEGVGAGAGDWRLRLRSDLDIEVLAYNRTRDGQLTTLHDLVPHTRVLRPGARALVAGHHVALFNPADTANPASRLRVVNPGATAAAVTIEGIDDAGASPGPGVELVVPAGASRTLTAQALESGEWAAGSGTSGRLSDGRGRWRLVVTADADIRVMSLLASPAGHLVNLSTAALRGEVVPSPTAPAYAAVEVTGRTTASAGTPVALRAKSVGTSDVAIERYEWEFSDGQRMSGEEVSVSFAAAGVYEVTVRAMSGTETVADTTAAVAVFDAAAGANPGFEGIPKLFGDVNRDGRFGPEDLALAERAAAGLAELEVEAIEAGDLDLSGALDERDVKLMRQAVAGGAALPSALLDTHAYPGGTVAMVSPALQDPDTDIEVYVGGTASPQVMRAILGYATFVVPASLAGENAEVVVLADKVVEERLRLALKPVVTPTVGAREDVLAFLGELAELIARHQQAEAEFIDQNGGLSAEDAAIVLGAAEAATRQLEAAAAEIEAVLDGEGGEELAALIQTALYANGLADFRAQTRTAQGAGSGAQTALYANGLADFRAQARTAQSGAGSRAASQSPAVPPSAAAPGEAAWSVYEVCTRYVPTICALKRRIAELSWGSAMLFGICKPSETRVAVSAFTALAPGAESVDWILARSCASVLAAMNTATVLGTIVNAMELGMRVTSDKVRLQGEEDTATITAEVTFPGLRNLCGSDWTVDERPLGYLRVLGRILRDLVKRSNSLRLTNDLVEEAAGIVGGALQQNASFVRVSRRALETLCDLSGTGPVASLTANAGHFNLEVSEGGVLRPNQDNSGTYRLACREGFSGTLEVTGNKDLCSRNKEDVVRVLCGEPCPGAADGEVEIPDAGLRAAVEEALGKPAGAPIRKYEMEWLKSLDARRRGVESLKGLQCATELEWLNLDNNQISDVSPLAGLTDLTYLSLQENQISDVSLLADLTALAWLELNVNQISDVSPLAGLTALEQLGLGGNQISDVSPLAALTTLPRLHLSHNQISDVSPLAALTTLKSLALGNNQISDVSPLAGLTALEWLDLGANQISDVSPLAGLTALKDLWLFLNRILDISPLAGLTDLTYLGLRENQISNIGALVSNAGLGHGDFLDLAANPLKGRRSCSQIHTLERRGVGVYQSVTYWQYIYPQSGKNFRILRVCGCDAYTLLGLRCHIWPDFRE